jgi:hypothetical protein
MPQCNPTQHNNKGKRKKENTMASRLQEVQAGDAFPHQSIHLRPSTKSSQLRHKNLI